MAFKVFLLHIQCFITFDSTEIAYGWILVIKRNNFLLYRTSKYLTIQPKSNQISHIFFNYTRANQSVHKFRNGAKIIEKQHFSNPHFRSKILIKSLFLGMSYTIWALLIDIVGIYMLYAVGAYNFYNI